MVPGVRRPSQQSLLDLTTQQSLLHLIRKIVVKVSCEYSFRRFCNSLEGVHALPVPSDKLKLRMGIKLLLCLSGIFRRLAIGALR
jgi:hypothetical protein